MVISVAFPLAGLAFHSPWVVDAAFIRLSWLGVLLFEGRSDLGPGLAEEFTLPGAYQLQCAP